MSKHKLEYSRHFNISTILVFMGILLLWVSLTSAVSKTELIQEPQPLDPWKAILEAFDQFPLVAISEAHGMKEEADFIASLIQQPEFPNKVNDIVLEAGNAKYQDIIDRYVFGETISLQELRSVWRNHTCSALGPMDSGNIEQFFVTARSVNQKLPPKKRLRVLAGDPPIDWSKIHRAKDFFPWLEQRDIHYAKVVEEEVLSKGRKALLIIGGAHLSRRPLPDNDPKKGVMLQILESKYPETTFIVIPHEGFGNQNALLEPRLANWAKPSLVILKDSWLGAIDTSDLGTLDIMVDSNGNLVSPWDVKETFKDKADAYLYLGPLDTLTIEGRDSDLFLDDAYFHELNRRYKLMHGRELKREELMKPRPKKWVDNFRSDVIHRKPFPPD